MDQTELTNLLTKTLMGIAACGVSEDKEELQADLKAIKHEARKALEVAGYDFELLMGGNKGRYLGTMEAEA